jgi:hypothetical protein
LLGRLDPRNDNSIRTDIKRALDKSVIQLGDSNQSHRITSNGGAKMFDDFFPVQVTMLGVNDNPVQA